MMPRAGLPALRCRTPRFAVNQFKVSPERTLLTRPEAARQRLDPICAVRGRTRGRSQGATGPETGDVGSTSGDGGTARDANTRVRGEARTECPETALCTRSATTSWLRDAVCSIYCNVRHNSVAAYL